MPNTDLTTTFRVNLQSKYINNDDGINVTNVRDNLNYFDIAQKLLEGVGANLANMQHYSRRRLINSIEVLDLETDLTNRWGDVLDFQNIKIGVIVNRQEEENRFLEVTIKGEQYYIGPRGFRVFYEPVDVGLIEVSSSEVPVGNLVVSSDSDITYDLILIGSGDTNLALIDHETGDLSQYDSTVTDGGDLSIVATGLRGSAYKMECLINDASVMYGQVLLTPPSSGELRLRFYLNADSLALDVATVMSILRLHAPSLVSYLLFVGLVDNSPNDNNIQIFTRNDADSSTGTAEYTLEGGENYIEILLVRATTNVAADGYVTLWLNGVAKETIANVDNYDAFALIDEIRFGAPSNILTTTGTLYLDELIVRDTDSEIGA